MRDPRLTQLAKQAVHYSIDVKQGEKVLIEMTGTDFELVRCMVEQVYQAGGIPFVRIQDSKLHRVWLMNATVEQMQMMAKWDSQQMSEMDGYIAIRASENISEFTDIPKEVMKNYVEHYVKPVHYDIRVKKTKWCIMRYPNGSMAQMANMSTEAFERFYFDVCNLNYGKMSKAMDVLVDLMNRTDRVRITGKGTDLSFSIAGIGTVKCDGRCNLPDGEVFTAPVKNSVNGRITYNAPSQYMGTTFKDISLVFQDGKIVEATADNSERLNEIFNTDDGARFIGEFAIAMNPFIKEPMNDILFDEKIDGSLHFTPGQAYEDADNGNRSAIHWDLVFIQRPEYGGGEIYFDDKLIRKDGRFVLPELDGLNPENLM